MPSGIASPVPASTRKNWSSVRIRGSTRSTASTTLFAAAAVAGFRSSAWIVVVALAGHGVFDAVHGYVIENAGMPAWWPAWCLAYDVGAAAGLAWLLRYGHTANHVKP